MYSIFCSLFSFCGIYRDIRSRRLSIVFAVCALFMVFFVVSAVSPLLAVVGRVGIAAGIVVVISARMAMRPNRRCKTA